MKSHEMKQKRKKPLSQKIERQSFFRETKTSLSPPIEMNPSLSLEKPIKNILKEKETTSQFKCIISLLIQRKKQLLITRGSTALRTTPTSTSGTGSWTATIGLSRC